MDNNDKERELLFSGIEESPDAYSEKVIDGIESVIQGTAEPQVEFDEDTQSFLDELSEFLEEEDTSYLKSQEDELPSLDELDDLPSLDQLIEETPPQKKLYEEDDDETKEIRAEGAKIALGLMNYVEFNVVCLENDLSVLGEAFNQLLDKTSELDDKISRLSDRISQSRLEGAKQALEFIHEEIKLISDNLEGAIKSTDPYDREILQENVDILYENKEVIEQQITGLKEVGAKTEKLENDLRVLDISITKLENAIKSNQVFSLANFIANEINQVIVQINDARRAEDMQDIVLLKENFDILMENRADIEEKIWDLDNKNIDIRGLAEQLEVLNINLQQFSRTIDDVVHSFAIKRK